MDEIKLYTLDEVDEILKVTRRTLYTYIKTGKLKANKVGRGWRVPKETLQAFIDGE